MLNLKDKVCIVTGASRGIGFAICQSFIHAEANVIMAVRDTNAVDELTSKIGETGSRHPTVLNCDVSQVESVASLFREVHRRFGRLDVLVSNAGILESGLIGMVTPSSVNQVFSVNTFGTIYCAQYASRLMARNKAGSIINIASIFGTHGMAGQAIYGGSKAAVVGITKCLAKELAGNNIRVNAIAPGFIDTDMARAVTPEKYNERINSISLKRAGTPEEVAHVALFLASDLSSYVTGQTIGVDGGMVI